MLAVRFPVSKVLCNPLIDTVSNKACSLFLRFICCTSRLLTDFLFVRGNDSINFGVDKGAVISVKILSYYLFKHGQVAVKELPPLIHCKVQLQHIQISLIPLSIYIFSDTVPSLDLPIELMFLDISDSLPPPIEKLLQVVELAASHGERSEPCHFILLENSVLPG